MSADTWSLRQQRNSATPYALLYTYYMKHPGHPGVWELNYEEGLVRKEGLLKIH